MSLSEEKKLIKEIEQLKTSKKTAAQFMSQEEVRIVIFNIYKTDFDLCFEEKQQQDNSHEIPFEC